MKWFLPILALSFPTLCHADLTVPDRREFPINSEINPCDNLYEYACSKVNETFVLPPTHSAYKYAFNDSDERLLREKNSFLKSLLNEKNLPEKKLLLKSAYSACLNKPARRIEERALVRTTVEQIARITEREAYKNLLGQNLLNGGTHPVAYFSEANLKDSGRLDLKIKAEPLQLPVGIYASEEISTAYQKLLEEFFAVIGDQNASVQAARVVAFEKRISRTVPSPEEMRGLWQNPNYITAQELRDRYPSLRFDRILDTIKDSTSVHILTPRTLFYLEEAFRSENLDTLKAYYTASTLLWVMDLGYPNFFKKKSAFLELLGGAPERRPLDEECTDTITQEYDKEIDSLLWRDLFPNIEEARLNSFAERIRGVVVDQLMRNSWLSREAKKEALLKVQTMRLRTVAPKNEAEWYFNPKHAVRPNSHLQNMRNLYAARSARDLKEATQPRDRSPWRFGPLTINAYFNPTNGEYVLPVGILQYPFYDPREPDHVNFGGIGAVIAHEISHSFDDRGSLYDHRGDIRQWMKPQDQQEFDRRTRPLVRQYNNAKPAHNGKLTLGENIADLQGLSFAYKAAFPENSGSSVERQEFFTAWARNWCGLQTEKMWTHQLANNDHSQLHVRTNEPVKHLDGFHEAFGCKKGDKLYLPPHKRLQVW